ncbi:hypothetical protein STEG23_011893 [Scotinomys teguina]
MSQLLFAILTLSGLLPNAEVLTVGADQELSEYSTREPRKQLSVTAHLFYALHSIGRSKSIMGKNQSGNASRLLLTILQMKLNKYAPEYRSDTCEEAFTQMIGPANEARIGTILNLACPHVQQCPKIPEDVIYNFDSGSILKQISFFPYLLAAIDQQGLQQREWEKALVLDVFVSHSTGTYKMILLSYYNALIDSEKQFIFQQEFLISIS